MSELHGSCLCNKVKYTVKQDEGSPAVPETAICSCEDCQKHTGGAHGLVITVKRKNLTWDDPESLLKSYHSLADSGKDSQRYFCGNCGSSFAQFADMAPDISWFTIGTLDRDVKMKLKSPVIEVYGKSRLPFTTENVNGKRFKLCLVINDGE